MPSFSSKRLPALNDHITLDVPEFIGTDAGFHGGISLAQFKILSFDSMLASIDSDAALRAEILAAINDRPGLAQRVMHAVFSRSPR